MCVLPRSTDSYVVPILDFVVVAIVAVVPAARYLYAVPTSDLVVISIEYIC